MLFDGDGKESLLTKLGFEVGRQEAPAQSVGEQMAAATAALQSAAAISPVADAHDDDFFNRELTSAADGSDFFDSAAKDGVCSLDFWCLHQCS